MRNTMRQPPNLLLVDDRPENLLALEAQLRTQDARLLKAASGREALDLLLANDVAVAIVDVQMPEMDGFELAELMRGSPRTRHIPIIFVTAGVHDRARVFKGYESGAVDFLIKPIETPVLASKVAVFLRLARQSEELAERVQALEHALGERRRAEEQLAADHARLLGLHEIGARLLRQDALSEMLQAAVEAAVALARADKGTIQIYDVATQSLRIVSQVGFDQAHLKQFATVHDTSPAVSAEAMRRRGRVVVEDVQNSDIFAGTPALAILQAAQVRAAQSTLLMSRTGALLGMLSTHWTAPHTPGDDTLRLLDLLARQVSDLIESRQREEALRASEARFSLLSRTAAELLRAEDPQQVIDTLCSEVMAHLGCHAFFNYLVDPSAGKLHLNAVAGIPEEEARRIEWLDMGAAVCGCVARDGCRIVADDIAHSSDPRVDLVRSYGIQVYCCHPLVERAGQVLGTLSFGAKDRPCFREDEIELMRVVADQVATAIQRLQARRALSITNAQLVESDRRKNDFMALLSHELRNPLAPIRNSLYILDRAAAGSEQAQRAKQVIDRQVNQLVRLVDDLLDVTRVARNKIQLHRQRLELGELVNRTAEDYRSELDKAGVALRIERSTRPVWVDADANRLAQAVGNLLGNAAKFTPAGGQVVISVFVDPAGKLGIVRVSDTGIGMRPDMVVRLFEPFMQADTTLDRSKGGLGLGLALVKGVVELHGGSVIARSAGLGKGSDFIIHLPLEVAGASAAASAPLPSRGPRHRILIIEDNEDAADSLREVLQLEQHEVAVAYDGHAGIDRARAFKPDLIFCDIGLPGLDGYQVAEAIRADPGLRNVQLVALSGYALPEDVERTHEAGFDAHLAKPPCRERMNALLARLSARSSRALSSVD
jgi:signal transduction histidine kinase/DNA-binding response OmpR family regulator